MTTTATKLVKQARAWLGYSEANGKAYGIFDVYNAQKPLPVGYKVKDTDAWCATFVSACAIKCGATDIIPPECSCPRMIALCQKLGIWLENENTVPKKGDIVFYDWDDSGKGDNKGVADHVGIVESVNAGAKTFTVIEGNFGEAVKRRTLAFNAKYLRGFARPKYKAEATQTKPATNAATGAVKKTKKTVDEIAREVIAGKWGNGEGRKKRLKAAGYDYAKVQARVNALLK